MSDAPTSRARRGRWVLLAYGFRPFFLLAGLAGTFGPLAGLAMQDGLIAAPPPWPAAVWHGHEMIFGFVVAAISGFLFTAVANWTGRGPVRGATLGALVALWLAGRGAMALSGLLPGLLVAVVDLAYFPVLAGLVLRELIAGRNRRNLPFPILLMAFFAANLLVHLDRLGVADNGVAIGLPLGVDLIALLITVVGGRIVPAFTTAALRRRGGQAGLRASPVIDRLSIAAVAAVAVLDIAGPDSTAAGAAALAAAALLAVRLAGWRGLATLNEPILWVLHLGYLWLVIGFLAKAGADLMGWLPPTLALHALTAGAAGTMILGVMSRAALGHTGRPLVSAPAMTWAYLLVGAGAALRLVGPLVAGEAVLPVLWLSAITWAAGYAIFTVVYWPILTRPRLDGRPG